MIDTLIALPEAYDQIKVASQKIQFSMASDLQTGSLLRTLVASKPGGRFLELGTGTGLSLSWMLEGMDKEAYAISVDNNPAYIQIAQEYLGQHPNVDIVCQDGEAWIQAYTGRQFDLIFADAWPGKYSLLDDTLALLKIGGIYFIDDMLPQPNWPLGHNLKVDQLLAYLDNREDLTLTRLNWSTGLVIVTKIA